jgi:orotate phosphoribosyltransferase-like protein
MQAAVRLLLKKGIAPEEIATELKLDAEWVKWTGERASW